MQLPPAQLDAYTKASSARAQSKTGEGSPAGVQGPTVPELLPDLGPHGGTEGVVGKGRGSRSVVVDLSPEATRALAQHMLETEVGQKIASAFQEVGVDLSQAGGQDWGVDATAQRIVDFSTGLYGVFRQQHSELGDEEALDLFEETLRGAVDKGYGEAIDILQGMSVSQDILDRADATISRVHSLYDDFFSGERERLAAAGASSQPDALARTIHDR